jgi:hypothetical protein
MSWRKSATDPWKNLAIAIACRVEFEQTCNRIALLDESAVVRFAAEYCQANWNGKIDVNYPHPDIDGKFIDLVGTRPRAATVGLAIEAKWVRAGGVRSWIREIAVDLFRLQHLASNAAQGAYRVLVVAGIRSHLHAGVIKRRVHAGGGTIRALPEFLPTAASNDVQWFDIRYANNRIRRWLRLCHSALGRNLPSSYDARLAGHHRSHRGEDACEVYVWVTKRPQGWGSFSPTIEWQADLIEDGDG